jgi:imidazolonepropionase-like amidohydrolase
MWRSGIAKRNARPDDIALSRIPREPAPLVIRGATLIPMAGERVLRGHSLLVEDGRIVAVAPAGELAAGDADVLDASGMFVTPGLCDMHVHYWEPTDANLFLAHGVTLVRNMWGSPFHLGLARRVERGELAGPRVVTTGPVIDGAGEEGGTVWPGARQLLDPAAAAAVVAGCAGAGYEQIKVYSWLRPDVLRALGRAARAAGLRMTGHCPEGVSFEDAVEAGLSCFEHLLGIERGHLRGGHEYPPQRRPNDRAGALRRLRLAAEHLDLGAVRRLAARMAGEQVWNCPTLVQPRALVRGRDGGAAGTDLRYQPPGRVAAWLAGGGDGELREARRRRNDVHLRVVSILHAEGAPLLAGTDTPNPFVSQGASLHDELANLVLAGLTPYEALRCATSEAARFLGRSAESGTLAPGRRADLVLTCGDPLQDPGALRRPEAVLVNGYRLSRADLDGLLAERARWVDLRANVPINGPG